MVLRVKSSSGRFLSQGPVADAAGLFAAPPQSHPVPAPQRLWLVLRLPALMLEIGQPPVGVGEAAHGSRPRAVVARTGRNPELLLANAAATALGVRAGMSAAMALSLAGPALYLAQRDEAAEAAALRSLGDWAWQFTPTVTLLPPDGLGLEVAPSLTLFGGLAALLGRVRGQLQALGHELRLGVAPTLTAADLLAQAGDAEPILSLQDLAAGLRGLPLSRLRVPAALGRLRGMGIHRLGGLLRLPRAGLAERLGPQLLHWLDQALGRVAEVPTLHLLEERYVRRIDFLEEIETASRLERHAGLLLLGLCGWLGARGLGLLQAEWSLVHAHAPATTLRLGLLEPSHDPAHLLGVQREQWSRLRLVAPVRALSLTLLLHAGCVAVTASLLRAEGRPGAARGEPAPERLVELLQARLGTTAVCGLAVQDEHRPERAWSRVAPGAEQPCQDAGMRPLWMLPQPLPLEVDASGPRHHGPLTLTGQPERIESGWWDGLEVARDYYTALSAEGRAYWIYRDLHAPGRWYLHGIFG